MNDTERKQYKAHMEALQYQRSVIQTGLIEGREEGRAEGWVEGHAAGHAAGHAVGHAEGHAEGHAKGRAEGQAEAMKTLAEKALKRGLSPNDIAELTGLTVEEVLRLST
jgi:predicted transposase YdaD